MPYWFQPETISFEIGGREMSIETGRIAKQAAGSALITYGGTVVLVTAVHSKPREGIDFFPLTVDFVEKFAAAGKIPGGFFKREGRLADREVLVSRFIDRSIRPLFADGYNDETQVTATVLSATADAPADMCAFVGASAALAISDEAEREVDGSGGTEVPVAPPPAPTPTPEATAAEPQPRTVRVDLRSEPPGAMVQVGERTFGPTPAQLEWSGEEAAEGREVTFRFQLEGHRDFTVTRTVYGDQLEVAVELEPIRPTKRSWVRRPNRPRETGGGDDDNSVSLMGYKAEPY